MRDVLLGDGNRPAGGKLLRTDAGAHRSGLRFANILSCPSGTMCPPSGSRADMLRECGVHSSLGLREFRTAGNCERALKLPGGALTSLREP